jgi:hypothetical protein
MARIPKPPGPNAGFAGDGDISATRPRRAVPDRARWPSPDRTREPRIGPACGATRHVVEGDTPGTAPDFTDELREGVEYGTSRGTSEPMLKTTQEFGDERREARGVRTRPPRPGQHA